MRRRGADEGSILDASDVMWWDRFGLLAMVPLFVVNVLDRPTWTGVRIALLGGVVAAPMGRRYGHRMEADRWRV